MRFLAAVFACTLAAVAGSACGKPDTPPADAPAPVPDVGAQPTPAPNPAPVPAPIPAVPSIPPVPPVPPVPPIPPVPPTPPVPPAVALQAVAIPADGKYENVKVCGVTVPMVNIMDGGTVVLIDTDGVKPRSWEEQYKRKGNLPRGWFDLHKTNVNRNEKFDDDPIDRQGRWRMDEKGNITQE